MDTPVRRSRVVFAALFALAVSSLHAATPEEPTPAATPSASPAAPAPAKSSVVENAVVKVFSTVRYPDPFKPWTKQGPGEATGSGVVIPGRRILTNAHVVQYSSQVQVQANQAGDKISATVEAIAPGIDLAVLKLEDDAFFDTHPPLEQATTLPEIKDMVLAYGYPKGGTSLSITKGIVSRIEFTGYNYPVSGLRVQIDAAINPGNSGGPVVVGEKMIGLAFSALGNAQNIGYIIPCEEIALFLADIADGRYDGKPALHDDCQTLENPALRSFLKLDKSVEGMVVHQPFESTPAYPLKEWDVIRKIGDLPVDNEGMIKLGTNLRVYFKYHVQRAARDGKVPLTIVRAGKEMTVSVPVPARAPRLVRELDGAYPSYFVFGPLVFSEATTQFVAGLGRAGQGQGLSASRGLYSSPLVTRMMDKPAFDGEHLVVVTSPFFPHKLSKGYGNPALQVVKNINGRAIKNLPHLVEVLRDLTEEFVTIEFAQRGGETLVFPRAALIAATDEILTDNGVRSQGSPDTMLLWGTKAGK